MFKNVQPSMLVAKEIFKKEMDIISLKAKARVSHTFDLWIQNCCNLPVCKAISVVKQTKGDKLMLLCFFS
jgi:hypothetical protein